MIPEQRIIELTDLINWYNDQYYQNSISEVDDFTFDQLLQELTDLEKQYPHYVRPDSPTARVGGTISKDFATVYHRFPMLSLGNTYSEADLVEFDSRVRRGLRDEPYEYICELKFDGVALSMTYENGVLVQGATRGDGVRGELVRHDGQALPWAAGRSVLADGPPRHGSWASMVARRASARLRRG